MNSAEREKITDIRNMTFKTALLTNKNKKEASLKAIEAEERETIRIILDSVKMLETLSGYVKRGFEGTNVMLMNMSVYDRKLWTAYLENSLKLIVKLSFDVLDEVKEFNDSAEDYIRLQRETEKS